MKTLFLFIAILLSGLVAKAQDIFFPSKEGTVLEYKIYDKKEVETGMIRYTITNIRNTGDNMDITYLMESTDAKNKPLFKEELTIHKKGDKLYVDMSKFLSKIISQKVGEKAANIEIKGNDMEIPSKLAPGDVLPDSNVEIALKVGFMNIKMSANVTNRKVESFEKINVKAGNFDTYKLTSTVTVKAMGMNKTSTSTEWTAKGIGMVKSESYDKKGNISSYTELVSIR